MLALIDADIVAYRVAWTTENDDEGIARWRCDEMLDGILVDTKATEYELWLSDSTENNFRTEIFPEYKANRKLLPKPRHLDFLKEHVIKNWGARFAYNEEADDALGIGQSTYLDKFDEERTVIASIDKDLLQIPGNHYNFVKKEHSFVTSEQGLRSFYTQMLVGDTSDNIKGCDGIGPVRASKAIGNQSDPYELFTAVFDTYRDTEAKRQAKGQQGQSEEDTLAHINLIGKLLKIRTYKGEVWHFPVALQIAE